MNYKCPLCGSPLSKQHYHQVIKSQETRDLSHRSEVARLRKQTADARRRAAAARNDGVLTERRKHALRDKHQSDQIRRLKEANRLLRRHTSPQEMGLADELVLVSRLKREFPEDRIQHTGRGGDVLQFVTLRREEIGCIVYECKRTDQLTVAHVKQTALAKRTRQAHFAILVTTGRRRGFAGLDQDAGVFIVAPAGVMTLAVFCRDSLVAMARQRLAAAERESLAKRLMDYVTSPTCKTPLIEVISRAARAQANLRQEMTRHRKDWEERLEIYQTIHHDVSHINRNILRVLNGEDAVALEKPNIPSLQFLLE